MTTFRKINPLALQNRYAGSLLGIVGKGPFGLAAGQWTDDTSIALRLAKSLVERRYDVIDLMERFVRWRREGYWSDSGHCFYIGNTTRAALASFEHNRKSYAGSTVADTAGNGSLMRLAPVVLYIHPVEEDVSRYSADHSRTTNAADEAVECCQLLAHAISRAPGTSKAQLLHDALAWLTEDKVAAVAAGEFRDKRFEVLQHAGSCATGFGLRFRAR